MPLWLIRSLYPAKLNRVHVHLVDASPYLFRAFFSLPKSIVDPKGRPVNAVHGFATFIARLLAENQPTHIAVAFDRHFNHSFRNEYYPPYKAHREASPRELEAQVDPALEVIEAFGVTTFIDERYEADDLIATALAQLGPVDATIVSPDKDLTQLVSDRVTLVDPAKGKRFDPAAVRAKFGVRPDQMADFLGLTGDAVDNIPGVRGIGPKGAANLLRKHPSVEAIYAGRDDEEATIARLSKRLATVATDAPIRVSPASLRYRGPDHPRLSAVLDRLGFQNLRVRLAGG